MKKLALLISILFYSISFSQEKANPMIVLDAKKIGFMKEVEKEMKALNPDDISTVTVFKDSLISKKYGSEYGVIIITTKKHISNTFYKDFIANSTLNEKIKSVEDLEQIGLIGVDSGDKNQPYTELSKYIFTNTINEKILKITEMVFLKPEDAIKLNPKWIKGALEIISE